MKKTLLLSSAMMLGAVSSFAQNSGPIKVKSGFTADVVIEALPPESHLVKGIDNGSVGFFTKHVKLVNKGLPSTQPMKAYESGNVYNIDYTKNNALRLVGPDDSGDLGLNPDGELYLAQPVKTSKLYFLAICGNGPTDLDVEVVYSDGSSSQATITVEDWWNASSNEADHQGKGEAFWGLDRIDRNNDGAQSTSAVRILEKSVETDATKEIESVYFSKVDVGSGYPTILGLSAGETAIEVSEGFNADVVAEAFPIGEHATVALDRNAWVLYSQDIELNPRETTFGLPDDGNIVTKSGLTFVMDYTTLNATRLTVDEPTTTLELEDIPTASIDGAITFLATAGNGPAQVEVKFNYEDGTTSTDAFGITDWCNHQSEAAVQTGRYYNDIDDRDFVGLYEYETYPEPDKAIKSITLTNTATDGASKGIVVGLYLTDGKITNGINDITVDEQGKAGKIYNMAGQRVNESYKGIVIKNGKKYIVK